MEAVQPSGTIRVLWPGRPNNRKDVQPDTLCGWFSDLWIVRLHVTAGWAALPGQQSSKFYIEPAGPLNLAGPIQLVCYDFWR